MTEAKEMIEQQRERLDSQRRAQAEFGPRPDAVRGPNALVVREPDMKWLDIPRDQLIGTLGASLYPGARPESIKMVLEYCEAAGLNVMLKPVHVVPMYVRPPGGGQGAMRDVVMPGINHYRTQASRTGTYLGKSEPEWGPLVEKTWGEFKLSVPEWCRITVKRAVGSHVAVFTAEEYWDENYATKGRDSSVPNAMWQKRPKGQLHKCTEAQALRMAFPELVGTETAEEMEGKVIDLTAEDVTARPAAVRHLDQFAGNARDTNDVVDNETGSDDTQRGEPEDAVTEELDDTVPIMPDEIWQPFYQPVEGAKPDWAPGWRWLNETLESGRYTAGVAQPLGVRYKALFWAVYAKGGAQRKAVTAFVEKHGIVVPPDDEVGVPAA